MASNFLTWGAPSISDTPLDQKLAGETDVYKQLWDQLVIEEDTRLRHHPPAPLHQDAARSPMRSLIQYILQDNELLREPSEDVGVVDYWPNKKFEAWVDAMGGDSANAYNDSLGISFPSFKEPQEGEMPPLFHDETFQAMMNPQFQKEARQPEEGVLPEDIKDMQKYEAMVLMHELTHGYAGHGFFDRRPSADIEIDAYAVSNVLARILDIEPIKTIGDLPPIFASDIAGSKWREREPEEQKKKREQREKEFKKYKEKWKAEKLGDTMQENMTQKVNETKEKTPKSWLETLEQTLSSFLPKN